MYGRGAETIPDSSRRSRRGVSNGVLSALHTRGRLLKVAQNAKKRTRGRAYQDAEGGEVPNCRSLAHLVSPMGLLSRPGGETFLLYDSGPGPERIAMFGAQSGVGYLHGLTSGAQTGQLRRSRISGRIFTQRMQ